MIRADIALFLPAYKISVLMHEDIGTCGSERFRHADIRSPDVSINSTRAGAMSISPKLAPVLRHYCAVQVCVLWCRRNHFRYEGVCFAVLTKFVIDFRRATPADPEVSGPTPHSFPDNQEDFGCSILGCHAFRSVRFVSQDDAYFPSLSRPLLTGDAFGSQHLKWGPMFFAATREG